MLGALLALHVLAVPVEAPPAAFALLIGNNRSLQLARPDLRFADDDALKYRMLFRQLFPPEHIMLLTRPDDESTRLMPDDAGSARPPTHAALQEAVHELSTLINMERAAGRKTVLYLAFAGHGDVEKGRGYMELEDGPLTRDELQTALATIQADTTHLLLDSCNAFFVVHPRRPGGRAWSTPADATQGLQVPGSDVGVFLSTDAEAQVYEWTQLQSGLFSHAVRSGLMGAADANHDGRITYEELHAFVATANAGIANSLYRPHLFVKAPSTDATLLDLRGTQAQRVRLAGALGRVTLRNPQGVRLWDVHAEAGFEPELIVTSGEDTVYVQRMTGRGSVIAERVVGNDAVIEPGMLGEAESNARGVSAVFEQYFSVPYGPEAVTVHRLKIEEEPPLVFGLSREAEGRLLAQLEVLADARRVQQVVAGITVPVLLLAPFPVAMALAGAFGLAAWKAGGVSIDVDALNNAVFVGGLVLPSLLAGFAFVVASAAVLPGVLVLPLLVGAGAIAWAVVLRNVDAPGSAEATWAARLRHAPSSPRERAARLVADLEAYERDALNRRLRHAVLVGGALAVALGAVAAGAVTAGLFLALQVVRGGDVREQAAGVVVGAGAFVSMGILLAGVGVALLIPQQEVLHARLMAEAVRAPDGGEP